MAFVSTDRRPPDDHVDLGPRYAVAPKPMIFPLPSAPAMGRFGRRMRTGDGHRGFPIESVRHARRWAASDTSCDILSGETEEIR
ncbi:MAG: hypothetical protein ACOC3D_00175 [Pseudomonadota bacterium]